MRLNERNDYKEDLETSLGWIHEHIFRNPDRYVAIFSDWVNGATYDVLGKKYDFSRERGRQIVFKCQRIILRERNEKRKMEDPDSFLSFLLRKGVPYPLNVRVYNCLIRHCLVKGYSEGSILETEKIAKDFLLNAPESELITVRNLGAKSLKAILDIRQMN